jgi:hypothetical protein
MMPQIWAMDETAVEAIHTTFWSFTKLGGSKTSTSGGNFSTNLG